MKKRTATISRTTNETQVSIAINLDGTGIYSIKTPIGFLNHMLEQFAKNGMFDLAVKAVGDVQYDGHHVIEDVGIVLGQVLKKALQDKRGINRYGSKIIPMDDVLCLCAIDLGGRFAFETNYAPVRENVNDFPTEMMSHFFESVAINAMMNLHIQFLNPGKNEHHRLEAAFKSSARALREACSKDTRSAKRLPTTKGLL